MYLKEESKNKQRNKAVILNTSKINNRNQFKRKENNRYNNKNNKETYYQLII